MLEMNQGWFAKTDIKAGTKLAGAPFRTALSRPRRKKKAGPRVRPFLSCAELAAQPKFFCAKSQLASLSRKVSTNFGRRLR